MTTSYQIKELGILFLGRSAKPLKERVRIRVRVIKIRVGEMQR